MHLQDTALESRKVLITENMRAEVRRGLTVEENKEVDEVMLNQFLRATKHDVPKVFYLLSPANCISSTSVSDISRIALTGCEEVEGHSRMAPQGAATHKALSKMFG